MKNKKTTVITKTLINETLRQLFTTSSTREMCRKGLQFMYPELDREKHLPATTKLTIDPVARAAFGPSIAPTCHSGLERHGNSFLLMQRSTWKDPAINTAQGQGEEHRSVFSNQKGKASLPNASNCSTLMGYLRNWQGRFKAITEEYGFLFRQAFPNSPKDEQEQVKEEIIRIIMLLEDVIAFFRSLLVSYETAPLNGHGHNGAHPTMKKRRDDPEDNAEAHA